MTATSPLIHSAAEAHAAQLRREAALTRALDGMQHELDLLVARRPRRSRVMSLLRAVHAS
ncbi:MAG TPA: hypothetical protein VN618_05000 [Solirubrobacteraceae bacterium]|nr:hypothetical protein [Solirubrobacteraceae bacterium]